MAKTHTPGPWQMSGVRGTSPVYKGHGVGPDGQPYVVIVPYNDKDHAECLANARLIAAAPDMLAALKALVTFFESTGFKTGFLADSRAAIAKAEGRNALARDGGTQI